MKSKPQAPDVTELAGMFAPAVEYWVDAAQRGILFWDVMRQRGNQYREHQADTTPHVLEYEVELVVDGRKLARPVNYALARVIPPPGAEVDQTRRPFVVVDPRAGHGPGIGGFKADSEIGVAFKAGHPCYFVGFLPEPEPGQTIEDIARAEAVFLEKVIALHPRAEGKPCVVGNCQGGWSVLLVAGIRPELFGPIIVAGSPLSYWAGVEGENPMRYTGGLAGGSWMTALASDLGNGKFDGGMLVENFENLNPSNTLWTKKYNLWANVDTEGPRFIEFEKWWGQHVNLNAEEIQWIVDELFVGNRLATAEIVTRKGERVDLRNIRSPIICFCSKGDNITPPQQALGWINDLYGSDDEIRACGQTIIYAVHDTIGHLGIFVSGGVAKKEHQEFASNIDLIDVLPPGLYEAVMTRKTAESVHQEAIGGDWIVRFEARTLNDIHAIVQPDPENERRFATVRRVSEINLGIYRTMVQPFVKAFMTDETAAWLKESKNTELPFEVFSDRNPMMKQVAELAEQVRSNRQPAAPDNPLLKWQEVVSDGIVAALDGYRDQRDAALEKLFLAIYGSPVLQAMVGTASPEAELRPRPGLDPERVARIRERISELKAGVAKGGAREAAIRALLYVGMGEAAADERSFNTLRAMRAENDGMTLEEFKQTVREQYFSLVLDPERALAAIPDMLPADATRRKRILDAIRRTGDAAGAAAGERAARLAKLEELFASGARGATAKKTARKTARPAKSSKPRATGRTHLPTR